MSNALTAGANRDDFVATVDGFIYVGNSIEELRGTLQKTNSLLLER
jgi:hypothetical protein